MRKNRKEKSKKKESAKPISKSSTQLFCLSVDCACVIVRYRFTSGYLDSTNRPVLRFFLFFDKYLILRLLLLFSIIIINNWTLDSNGCRQSQSHAFVTKSEAEAELFFKIFSNSTSHNWCVGSFASAPICTLFPHFLHPGSLATSFSSS